MRRRLVGRIILLGVLGLSLVAVSGLPAAAQPTVTVELGETATLVAKGAAVQVPVIYSCSPDAAFTALNVIVNERVGGNRIAQGGLVTSDLTCDGAQHTALVTVTSITGNAFHKGVAFVQADLSACDVNGNCVDVPTSGTIKIVKKFTGRASGGLLGRGSTRR
jgi:hypothetical protein